MTSVCLFLKLGIQISKCLLNNVSPTRVQLFPGWRFLRLTKETPIHPSSKCAKSLNPKKRDKARFQKPDRTLPRALEVSASRAGFLIAGLGHLLCMDL